MEYSVALINCHLQFDNGLLLRQKSTGDITNVYS